MANALKEVNYDMMHQTLQHPLWAIIYMICIVAVVFTLLTVFGHFSDMGDFTI